MADKEAHLNQSKHNEELLHQLMDLNKQTYFADWYITICFYSALHIIEAVIFHIGVFYVNNKHMKVKHTYEFKSLLNQSEHAIRSTLIHNNPEIFKQMSRPYGNLHEMSRTARYNCHKTPSNEYIDAEKSLDSIKQESQKLFSSEDTQN